MWDTIVKFFNSNFFVSLSTILTIGGAIYLYLRQKRENKQQIATLLVNDIRNAQAAIQVVRDSLNTQIIPEITVLPENNWKKYSYLFSKDLDQDDTALLNKFFSDVERVSYIVTQANNMLLVTISDRDAAIQNANINIVANSKNLVQARKKLATFDGIINQQISTSPYVPSGFYTKLHNYLPGILDLLSTEAGRKLKNIANIN
ncbi:hypothetical protein HY086_05840 [Candidatus Gottesmanbacteria bacterium]|nr:hypothetical protein [Candidatus Gottesmanbacteria bacterium]